MTQITGEAYTEEYIKEPEVLPEPEDVEYIDEEYEREKENAAG